MLALQVQSCTVNLEVIKMLHMVRLEKYINIVVKTTWIDLIKDYSLG